MMDAFAKLAYLLAAVLFIFGLKRLSSPATARSGNWIASLGMLIAIVATLGFEGVVIKAHGRSEGRAIRNAVKVAAKAVRGDLITRIQAGVAASRLGDPTP